MWRNKHIFQQSVHNLNVSKRIDRDQETMGAWKKENDTPNRKKYLKRQLVELRSDVVLIQLRTGKIKVANSCPETCYTTKSIQHLLELSDLSSCVTWYRFPGKSQTKHVDGSHFTAIRIVFRPGKVDQEGWAGFLKCCGHRSLDDNKTAEKAVRTRNFLSE